MNKYNGKLPMFLDPKIVELVCDYPDSNIWQCGVFIQTDDRPYSNQSLKNEIVERYNAVPEIIKLIAEMRICDNGSDHWLFPKEFIQRLLNKYGKYLPLTTPSADSGNYKEMRMKR